MSILGVCEDGWIMCPTEVLTGSALPSSALRFFFDDLSPPMVIQYFLFGLL